MVTQSKLLSVLIIYFRTKINNPKHWKGPKRLKCLHYWASIFINAYWASNFF